MNNNRRNFIAAAASAAALPLIANDSCAVTSSDAVLHIATNTYPWLTFARRDNQEFNLHSDELLSQIAETRIVGYEPIIESPAEFERLGARLKEHQLEMRSIYVNSVLHDAVKANASIEEVIEIANAAQQLGTQIVVTNPAPIRWGGAEDKSDAQLRLQAKSLDRLGAELRQRGITLAYHNHDAELRHGGREFHHMLTATDPDNVKFCLDAHWVFRGCGDSEVAVFDALKHYGERIVELHLRQSTNGVWNEVFAPTGDINYKKLFRWLAHKGISPHLVLEQAVETGSPHRLSAVAAHSASQKNLRTMMLNSV